MPFALTTIGLILIVTGARNTFGSFGSQVAKDFTGPQNFTWWIASLGVVGAVGYIPKMRGLSTMFMTLIIITMVLSNKGFFAKLQDALKRGPVAPAAAGGSPQGGGAPSPSAPGQTPSGGITGVIGNAAVAAGVVGPQGENPVSSWLDRFSAPFKMN